MISIIVPVYNIEKYIEKCVTSITNQSYKDIEILLIDDGSTDNSPNICDNLAKNDKRITVIHKANGGLSDARNYGLDIAKGDYIGFVDGDDFIAPDMYEYLLNLIINNKADISMCSYFEASEQTSISKAQEDKQQKSIEILESDNKYRLITELSIENIVAWNKLYKREIFDNIRFKTGVLHEDQWIIPYIIHKSTRIAKSPAKLYYYMTRSDSISNTKIKPNRMWDLLEALLNTCTFFKEHNLIEHQKLEGRHLCNYIMLYYDRADEDFNNPDAIRKELRAFFKKTMSVCSNVFSWRQLSYKAFLFNPKFGIKIKKIREKI